jgi:REP element-mobilizing transposase RayT
MTNHLHLIFRTTGSHKPQSVLGDFKKFTSRSILHAIKENPQESRKEWLLQQFAEAGSRTSNVKNFQFWQHNNKPIEVWSNKVIAEKVNYIHQNPVKEGLVAKPEDYLYSSARDYTGEKGYLENVFLADLNW